MAFCLENAKKCIFLPNLVFTHLVVKKNISFKKFKNFNLFTYGLSVRTGIVTTFGLAFYKIPNQTETCGEVGHFTYYLFISGLIFFLYFLHAINKNASHISRIQRVVHIF